MPELQNFLRILDKEEEEHIHGVIEDLKLDTKFNKYKRMKLLFFCSLVAPCLQQVAILFIDRCKRNTDFIRKGYKEHYLCTRLPQMMKRQGKIMLLVVRERK